MISKRLKFFLKLLLFVFVGFILCRLFPSYFGMIDVQALNNSFTNFKYAGNDLNVAKFYTVPAGNNMVLVNGKVDTSTTSSFSTYMYINLNVCTDMYLNSINSPNGIDNMYVYQSGQTCNFNGSSYKGKVFNIYFRAFKTFSTDYLYSGSFYLNSSNEHSIELINYYANVEGFPMNNNQSYAKDLQELKDILQNSNSSLKDSIDKNTEENKKTNDILKDDNIDNNININQDDLTDDSGLQDLLLMPLTLMNAVNNGFNSSCSSFSLGSLYGHDLSLKCFTISDVIGSNLAGIIDVIISGIFIYLFSKHLRKVFDKTTNLESQEGDVI